jgi:hypothetical protein
LKAGLAAAGAGLWPLTPNPLARDDDKAKETLDLLLEKYRRHQWTGQYAGSPGGGNHIPMTLIAAWRMGASSDQLDRYAARFRLRPDARPLDVPAAKNLTRDTWRRHLGRAGFLQFVRLFDDWSREASAEVVLKECAPALASGPGGAFSHDLLRLGYAIDCGSREEIAYSLAAWAAGHQPSPGFDDARPAVEPDALLAEIVESTANLKIRPDGGRSGPIAFRLQQVYGAKEFTGSLRPVRLPESDPMARISELIQEAFAKTHDFTLLHALTTCQAMRLVLPFTGDPHRGATAFWHSACAVYLTVRKVRPEMEQDDAAPAKREWKDVFAKALGAEGTPTSTYEHTIKLAYSCWLEAKHYKRDRYLALAAREVGRPASFV